ncbi:DUF302 domain-containing protein [Clostridium polynesiense]|uniref:DUF302 domain-containing protein n=1 Tax=Clostridium polynesiense TaxID=1325933 RepID=UPI0005911E99|nr:DUF302 domain-containing protein [Clostridium polynesiense]
MENIKYEVTTEKSFEEAVESVIKSLKDQKFGVLWQVNFKDKLQEKGVDFNKNFMVLEVCNPHKAKEVLEKHLDVGYFLPCKVVVYEDSNSVKIGMLSPEKLIGLLGYEDLNETAKEVQKTIASAIDNAK